MSWTVQRKARPSTSGLDAGYTVWVCNGETLQIEVVASGSEDRETLAQRIASALNQHGSIRPEVAAYIAQAEFSLYNGVTDDPRVEMIAQRALAEGRSILSDLMTRLAWWEETYREAGARDTAAREAIAVEIAKLLGLKGYADQ